MSDVINGVPRELLERLLGGLDEFWEEQLGRKYAEQARALLTAQPQAAPDEAVAQWQSMSCGEGGRWFNIADSDAEQAKSDGFEVRALYTHPAPSQPSGRVELSRQFVDAVKQLCKDFSDLQNRPYMGDVYAALDGLLEHEQIPVAATPHPEQPQASAAQSAPAGEREAPATMPEILYGPATHVTWTPDHTPKEQRRQVVLVDAEQFAAWQRAQSAGVPDAFAGLSSEAASTVRGMVEYCLNQRVCLGMDEGFKSFEPEIEHDFVKELRAFAEGAAAPAQPAAQDEVQRLREALEKFEPYLAEKVHYASDAADDCRYWRVELFIRTPARNPEPFDVAAEKWIRAALAASTGQEV